MEENRLSEAKKQITRRVSADSVKSELRKEFFNRLRSSRSQSFDKLRNIFENHDTAVSEQLKRDILDELQTSSLVDNEEIDVIFSEILQEIRENEEALGLKYLKEEEEMVKHLFNCIVCDRQIDFNQSICENCRNCLQEPM